MIPERIHRAMQELERRGIARPRSGYGPAEAEKIAETFLEALSAAIGGHGVESAEDDGHRTYWRGVACLYVNMGDSEAVTAIYDTDEAVMTVKSLADFIEEKEAEGATFA